MGYLSARYGRKIIGLIAKPGHSAAFTIIVVVIVATLAVFYNRRGRLAKDLAYKYFDKETAQSEPGLF